MRQAKTLLVAAGLALVSMPKAEAIPVEHSFSVTATTGPLSGITQSGTFAYDTNSIVLGGSNLNTGLLTALNFTWNGIAYDQTTANTGWLTFDATGDLKDVLFGNVCGPGTCSVSAFTNQWYVIGLAATEFAYSTPTNFVSTDSSHSLLLYQAANSQFRSHQRFFSSQQGSWVVALSATVPSGSSALPTEIQQPYAPGVTCRQQSAKG